MSNKDIAEFAAQVVGSLGQVEKSHLTRSRTNPIVKINPYEYLNNTNDVNASQVPPQAVRIKNEDNIDPRLMPQKLDDILIPIPDDIKKKIETTPNLAPPNQPIKESPQNNQAQLEFAFGHGEDKSIPQTPKDMFTYFKERLDMIDFKLKGLTAVLIDIRDRKRKPKENKND